MKKAPTNNWYPHARGADTSRLAHPKNKDQDKTVHPFGGYKEAVGRSSFTSARRRQKNKHAPCWFASV